MLTNRRDRAGPTKILFLDGIRNMFRKVGQREMNVQSFVVYGLVIIFFIVIAALVPFVLAQPEAQHNEPEEKPPEKASSSKTGMVAYGLTAALFALFIGITFIAQKERGRTAPV